MIDISIIFPSRQRTKKLGVLLDSIASTTSDISRIEVMIAVDADDEETREWLKSQPLQPHTTYYIGERATNFSEQYYNWLYRQSTGRYVMALNDDTKFLTKGWDKIAVEALDAAKSKWPDGAVYGSCQDGYGAMFCCFPILSHEAVEAQGWYFHPGFTAWGADVHVWRIWRALGRVVELPFAVDHISYHTGLEAKPDEVHKRMRALSRYVYETTGAECVRIEKALKEK